MAIGGLLAVGDKRYRLRVKAKEMAHGAPLTEARA